MEKCANAGGMLPEQLWDDDDLPGEKFKRGEPGGSAMPLCWSHAEYLSLVRSHKDGVCFDCIEPVYQRYAKAKTSSKIEIWTLAHQLPQIAPEMTLRIVTDHPAKIRWSIDAWITADIVTTHDTGLGCWFADLPTTGLPEGSQIVFTIPNPEGSEEIEFEVQQPNPATETNTNTIS